MRFIGLLRAKGACEQRASRNICRPGFAERAHKGEQYRTCGERDRGACVAYDMAACVHDEGARSQYRFNLLKEEGTFLTTRNHARGGSVQDEGGAFDLCRQRRDAGMVRRALGRDKGSACRPYSQPSHRDASNSEFMGSPQSRPQGRSIELCQRAFGLVETSDQEKTPNLEMLRVRGVRPIAVRLECRLRGVERLGGKAQVAGDECNLGFGNDAPRTSYRLFGTKSARRPSQQSLRSNKVAELGHRDAAKRQSRRIVAQSDPLQCTERVALRQCMRCASD
jgi:hypothetical protein